MPKVVGIRFKPVSKIYYFDPHGFEDLEAGDYVVVETARGREVGRVSTVPSEISDEEVVGQLKPVVRRATAWDLVQMQTFRDREQEALARCREKVAEYNLPMKMVKAEYSFDGSRLVFYFTAEKRVDFRLLVRDLAKIFRTRIELRQIGVRDEAKLLGGLGPCGRPLCCSSYLCEFSPVSIKMAKQQDLPLSPMEISGLCGRLLCCLAYENDHYCETKQKLPKVGEMIVTQHGRGKVVGLNVLKEAVEVELESEVTVEVAVSEVQPQTEPKKSYPRSSRRRRRRKTSTQ